MIIYDHNAHLRKDNDILLSNVKYQYSV